MAIPMTYMTFNSGGSSKTFRTTINGGFGESNVIAVACDGLLEGGENDFESSERTYSNGSVLSPFPRYSGRDFSVDFLIYSRNKSAVNIKGILKELDQFFRSGNMRLTTDYPHDLTVQHQNHVLDRADWLGAGRVILRVFFKADR